MRAMVRVASTVSSVTHQRRVPGCLRNPLYFVSAFRPKMTDTRQAQSATKATWNAFQAPLTSPTSTNIILTRWPPTRRLRALRHKHIRGLRTKASPPQVCIPRNFLQMSAALAILGLSHSIRNIRQSIPNCHSKDTEAPVIWLFPI